MGGKAWKPWKKVNPAALLISQRLQIPLGVQCFSGGGALELGKTLLVE